MTAEENKAIVRRYYEEIWNQGYLDAADELVTENHTNHNAMRGQEPGRESFKRVVATTRAAFDAHATIEDMIAEGNKVVARITTRARHRGDFMGVAATGKEVTVTGIDIFTIEDGKVADRWGEADTLGLMRQLGVAPLVR